MQAAVLDPLTGRVVAVGNRSQTRGSDAEVDGRARVIDVEGRWVLPGLIDVHVHENAVADAKAALVRGATTVRPDRGRQQSAR